MKEVYELWYSGIVRDSKTVDGRGRKMSFQLNGVFNGVVNVAYSVVRYCSIAVISVFNSGVRQLRDGNLGKPRAKIVSG